MVKVISLSDEAYRRLRARKGNKSFSEIVIEYIDQVDKKKKKNLMDFYGIWADDADEWEEIKKKIYEDRKKAKLREVRF